MGSVVCHRHTPPLFKSTKSGQGRLKISQKIHVNLPGYEPSGMRLKMFPDFLMKDCGWVLYEPVHALNHFEQRHLVVHAAVFAPLLRSLLSLVSGLVKVWLVNLM